MRVGMVGAGRMGGPMVGRLVAAGHAVTVLGRSEQARADLAAEGARAVADLGDVGDAAEVVLVCVFTDEQVRDVCLHGALLDRMPDGSVLVVHTTGHPRTVEAIAERAADRAVAVLDAPVSGGPHDIAAGRITLFVGGAAEAVTRAEPALRSYAEPVLHVGALGAGQRVKLLNNALFAAHIGLLRDAARLGVSWGVAEPALLEALTHGSAASRALTGVAARGSVARFAEAVGEFLGKDVDNVRKVAADLDGDLGALDRAIDALTSTD
jgi:3-hydroxyisobutyrate dehydrogenase-like beta-hydroxyacid dehydrogenase